MKKLLAISTLVALLAACSNDSYGPHRGHHRGPKNPEADAAIKARHEQAGRTRDFSKFDAARKEKGFGKPKHRPNGPDPRFK